MFHVTEDVREVEPFLINDRIDEHVPVAFFKSPVDGFLDTGCSGREYMNNVFRVCAGHGLSLQIAVTTEIGQVDVLCGDDGEITEPRSTPAQNKTQQHGIDSRFYNVSLSRNKRLRTSLYVYDTFHGSNL